MPRYRLGVGLAAVLAVAAALPLVASAQDANKAIVYRLVTMKESAWHIGLIAAMAKGNKAFDSASLQSHAEALAALSQVILEGFPAGSTGADSRAKPEIWTNWADFEAKAEALQNATAALAAAAPTLTKDTLGAALQPAGAACSGCHDDYLMK